MEYFTGDLHAHHNNVCKFTQRPWNVEDNIDRCIQIWNSRAKDSDVIYHLGDFSFGGTSKFNEIKDMVRQLNGKHHFILGNHDQEKNFFALKELMPGKILSVSHYKEIYFGKKKVVLCHYPILSWNNMQYGSIMLHGHLHSTDEWETGKIMDVGLDSSYTIYGEHKLISRDEVLKYMKNRSISSDKSHH
jgi:calcineurin-like phosphoesterase family protein